MGFSRQEYWRGLPFSSPGDLPSPGIEPGSPALQVDSLLSESTGSLVACLLTKCLLSICFMMSAVLVTIDPKIHGF